MRQRIHALILRMLDTLARFSPGSGLLLPLFMAVAWGVGLSGDTGGAELPGDRWIEMSSSSRRFGEGDIGP